MLILDNFKSNIKQPVIQNILFVLMVIISLIFLTFHVKSVIIKIIDIFTFVGVVAFLSMCISHNNFPLLKAVVGHMIHGKKFIPYMKICSKEYGNISNGIIDLKKDEDYISIKFGSNSTHGNNFKLKLYDKAVTNVYIVDKQIFDLIKKNKLKICLYNRTNLPYLLTYYNEDIDKETAKYYQDINEMYSNNNNCQINVYFKSSDKKVKSKLKLLLE